MHPQGEKKKVNSEQTNKNPLKRERERETRLGLRTSVTKKKIPKSIEKIPKKKKKKNFFFIPHPLVAGKRREGLSRRSERRSSEPLPEGSTKIRAQFGRHGRERPPAAGERRRAERVPFQWRRRRRRWWRRGSKP